MEKSIQFYYEKFKIADVSDTEDGRKVLKLETGENEYTYITLPVWEYEATVTDKESDASAVRNSRAIVVVDKVYSVLKDMDIRTEDIGFITQKLITKFSGVEEAATNKAFGVSNQYEIRLASHYDK